MLEPKGNVLGRCRLWNSIQRLKWLIRGRRGIRARIGDLNFSLSFERYSYFLGEKMGISFWFY